MSNPLAGVDPRWLLYGAAIAGVGFVAWQLTKAARAGATLAAEGLATVGAAINPASDQNLAYRGVNAIGSGITGDSSWTLGGWIYDVTHPSEEQLRAVGLRPAARGPAERSTVTPPRNDDESPSPFNVGA